MSDTKGKVNLLDTVPVQCGHITTEWEGEYAILSFPRFKYDWMRRFFVAEEYVGRYSCEAGRTRYCRMAFDRWKPNRTRDNLSAYRPFPKSEDNYPSRVTTYIMQLQKDGFIQLKVES